MASPQASEIIALATSLGYKQRRAEVSLTLFFEEEKPEHDMPPVLINIYYTTRSIMSYLNHPTMGKNEMWRSNAYKNLDELRSFFESPRRHSGKGYRRKNEATRGCARCGEFKKRTEFSNNQWIKGPDVNRCKACVAVERAERGGKSIISSADDTWIDVNENSDGGDKGHGHDDDISELSDVFGEVEVSEDYPSLTSNLLDAHNNKQDGKRDNLKLERRQFNCPECPKHGRGKYVFFKKVPAYKPIVKCPKCKRATRGKCMRLYPVPKSAEKGYGLFKCRKCDSTWGSSRAVGTIGQQCLVCKEKGKTAFVKPFRLEVVKKSKTKSSGGILGGGPRANKSMRRVPRNPVGEDEEVNMEYTERDRARNENTGNNALLRGKFGGGFDDFSEDNSYIFEPREKGASSHEGTLERLKAPGVRSSYVHLCEGCKTGICKSRYLPKSLQHDVSDGNTVSTSGSCVTNSSIDKSEFIDRDEDFTGFEDDECFLSLSESRQE